MLGEAEEKGFMVLWCFHSINTESRDIKNVLLFLFYSKHVLHCHNKEFTHLPKVRVYPCMMYYNKLLGHKIKR